MRANAGVLAIGLAVGTVTASVSHDLPIELVSCGGTSCIEVSLDDAVLVTLAGRKIPEATWRETLAIRTSRSFSQDPPGPTVFGRFEVHATGLLFRPRLPFLPGDEYVATLDLRKLDEIAGEAGTGPPAADANPINYRFRIPQEAVPAPRVVAIDPAVDVVPANLLRAYVYFSTPMRPDLVTDYLRLVDEEGVVVEQPFVDVDGGLWDRDRTRLTLFFHPGRLKRGVGPHEVLGPPLREGRRYRLIVSAGWPAETGEPLEEPFEQTWEAGPADRAAVEPSDWTLLAPTAGTRDPLRVDFGEPLDRALALRLVSVTRDDRALAGSARVAEGGASWSFRPDSAWEPGEHSLRVASALEDLAGNNLRGLFDRDTRELESAALPVELPFRPHPSE